MVHPTKIAQAFRKIKLIRILSVLILLNVCGTQLQANGNSDTQAVVYFSSPIKINDIPHYLNFPNVQLISIRRQYLLDEQTIVDEYYVHNSQPNLSNLKNEYWKAYYAMLQDMLRGDEIPFNLDDENDKQMISKMIGISISNDSRMQLTSSHLMKTAGK